MPGPDPLTTDKIAKSLALVLDPVRREIDGLRFRPVLRLERTIAGRRNEIDFCIVNCALDRRCFIESNECACKKGDTQERALHVVIPMELAGCRASFTDSPLGEAKMR